MVKANKIAYPSFWLGDRPITAERVRYGRELLAARGVQRLLRIAYERQFETGEPGALPLGSIRRHLANEDSPWRVLRQAIRMRRAINNGSEYWIIRSDNSRGELSALAKVTPDRQRESIYINDVLSATPDQGLGSAALNAALEETPGRYAVELDGYQGSSVNEWFRRLGLTAGEAAEDKLAVGPHTLGQVAFSGASVADLTSYMQTWHPQLQAMRVE